MTTALDTGDFDMSPMAQLVQLTLSEAGHVGVPEPVIMVITDAVLYVLAQEAWNLQEHSDWHEANGTDGTAPGGRAVGGQPLRPQWGDVARWMAVLRK